MSSSPTPDSAPSQRSTTRSARRTRSGRRSSSVLVEEGRARRPGRVLDVGCGTGGSWRRLPAGASPPPAWTARPRCSRSRGASFPTRDSSRRRAEQLPFPGRGVRPRRLQPRRPPGRSEGGALRGTPGRALRAGGVVIVTFDRSHFGGYYLQRYFPSIRTIDEQRFPEEKTLRAELAAAGFVRTRVVPLRQEASVDRECVLRRVKARHISTLQLLDEAEYAAGLDRLERELPAVVGYSSHVPARRVRAVTPAVARSVDTLLRRGTGPALAPDAGRGARGPERGSPARRHALRRRAAGAGRPRFRAPCTIRSRSSSGGSTRCRGQRA